MADPRKAPRPRRQSLDKTLLNKRVKLHAATDEFMQGDRFGVITKVGSKAFTVKLDKSGRSRRFHPDNLSLA